MNITLEEFLSGIERSVSELPSLFLEWHTIDEDLRAEYVDQLEWLIQSIPSVMELAATEQRLVEAGQRLAAASAGLVGLREPIMNLMGISMDRLLPHSDFNDNHDGGASPRSRPRTAMAA